MPSEDSVGAHAVRPAFLAVDSPTEHFLPRIFINTFEPTSKDHSNPKEGIMSRIDIVKDLLRTLEQSHSAAASKHLTEDFVFSGPVPEPLNGNEFVEMMAATLQAFPDWNFHVQNLAEKGDQVTGFVQITGTHRGSLKIPGIPEVAATGKRIKLPRETLTCVFRGDKICEFTGEKVLGGGMPGIFQQLGVKFPQEAMA